MRSRTLTIGLGLIVVLSPIPRTGHAQLGGLVKKAKEKVAPGAAQSSTDQPARLPGPEVTPAAVDHLLAGLKAEKDARDRQAAQEKLRKDLDTQRSMDPTTRYYSCLSDKQKDDPRTADMQKLAKDAQDASQKGDQNKAVSISMQIQPLMMQIQQHAESSCASLKSGPPPGPTPEQQAILNAPKVPAEEAGAKAAGMTAVDYGQLKELVYTYLGSGKRAGLTDAEKQAVEAKRAPLKDGFQAIGM
ncbi:MAG TPA: hypothetical protein VEI47_04465 [Gemmatimonadales bacterium]|nr:hypothetical protein [Gemmatimonadales bacterium]